MPSEKRARQRAGREARLAAQAKAKKRRTQYRNVAIVAVVAAVIVGIAFLVSGNSSPKKKPPLSVGTTTTAKGATTTTSTTAPGATTTTVPGTTTTTALTASSIKADQQAANDVATKAGCPASTSARVNTQKYSAAPPMTIDTNKLYSATVVTTAGTFIMALNAKSAPVTTNNFVFLANKGYYHCVIFHRVIPGFMDQTGDPTGTGTGTPGYSIPDELPATAAAGAPQYPLYSVAMANSGANTGGSQFFIVDGTSGESLAPSYALFGRVITGNDVIDRINSEGNSSATSNGTPPLVTQRIISVTINEASGS